MAEVVASAVGIAAFAIRTGEKIIKLVAFIESVKEAPAEIRYLVTEMNVLRLLLSEYSHFTLELDQKTTPAMSECQQLCLHSTEILAKAAEDIHREISRNKMLGTFKAMAKKEMMAQLKERVRDARAMLHLSRQIYSESKQRQDHQQLLQLLLQQIESQMKMRAAPQSFLLPPNPSPSSVELHDSENRAGCDTMALSRNASSLLLVKHRKSSQAAWDVRIKAPWWLRFTTKVLELQGRWSSMSIGLNLRVYSQVPLDSPVMLYAQSGDVQAMQGLFSKGLASPFDRTDGGWSILRIAALHRQLEVCRMLLGSNLSTEVDRWDRLTSFSTLIFLGQTKPENFELLELLAMDGDDLPDPFHRRKEKLDANTIMNMNPRGDSRGLSWIMAKTKSRFFQQSLDERRQILLHLAALSAQPDLASMIRLLLGEDTITTTLCRSTVDIGQTLLHFVARTLGAQQVQFHRVYDVYLTKSRVEDPASHHRLQELLRLLQDLVAGGSRLHALGTPYKSPQTPFGTIMQGFTSTNRHNCSCLEDDSSDFTDRMLGSGCVDPFERVTTSLTIWLRVLYKSGVDLVEYGRRENRIQTSDLVQNIFQHTVWDPVARRRKESEYSMTFVYGSKPGDWQFLFREQMDDNFSEFWEMVDHPEWAFVIPGSWNDDYVFTASPPWEPLELETDSDDGFVHELLDDNS